MKYPRLPEKLDRRKKLFKKDIQKIREKRKNGISVKLLAKIYDVSRTLIYYWTNPKINKLIKEHARKCRKEKSELARNNDNLYTKYISKVNPLYKKWQLEIYKKYYETHKIQIKKYMKEYYHKHKKQK